MSLLTLPGCHIDLNVNSPPPFDDLWAQLQGILADEQQKQDQWQEHRMAGPEDR